MHNDVRSISNKSFIFYEKKIKWMIKMKFKVIESEINKLNISDNNCSYCYKQFTEELWCKDCDTFRIIEGWTSGNPEVDKFIKDTMYNARQDKYSFLEWVPFNRFMDIKQIDEGGFAKVYAATWIDGPLSECLEKQNDGS